MVSQRLRVCAPPVARRCSELGRVEAGLDKSVVRFIIVIAFCDLSENTLKGGGNIGRSKMVFEYSKRKEIKYENKRNT